MICIDQLEAGTAEDCTVVVKAEQQTVAGSQLSSGRERVRNMKISNTKIS